MSRMSYAQVLSVAPVQAARIYVPATKGSSARGPVLVQRADRCSILIRDTIVTGEGGEPAAYFGFCLQGPS